MTSSEMELKQIYEAVIEDVIHGVQKLFSANGVEKSVLENLRRLWIAKLLKIGVLPNDKDLESTSAAAAEDAVVPLQIIFLSEPLQNKNTVWEIQMPLAALNWQLVQQKMTTNTVINLPKQVLDASTKQKNVEKATNNPSSSKRILNSNVHKPRSRKYKKIDQTDGTHDSSNENDSSSEVEDNSGKNKLGEDLPLNSDDDVSEDDETFNTDNIIVCQYEKISRRFNKWKLHLKSGIMNLDGKDHLFKCLIGEADW